MGSDAQLTNKRNLTCRVFAVCGARQAGRTGDKKMEGEDWMTMAKRDGYYSLTIQLPEIVWDALRRDSDTGSRSVTRIVTDVLAKHYRIERALLPMPKRTKPKVRSDR